MKLTSTLLSFALFIIVQNGVSQNAIQIGSAASFSAKQNSTIVIDEASFINEGTTDLQGNLQFTSTSNKSFVNDSDIAVSANNVSFSGAEFDLSGLFTISSSITLTNSANLLLTTNTKVFLEQQAEIIGENEIQTIQGTDGSFISITKDVTTSNDFGNIGISLNSANVNLGQTEIYRHYGTFLIDDEPTMYRYYEISPSTNSNLNADVTFQYATIDLNGLSESTLSLFRSEDGQSNWIERGGFVDEINNTMRLTGIDAFSTWAFSSAVSLLPVELLYFEAEAIDNTFVLCKWETASETNNSHFEIERSQNGQQFEFVTQVEGNGTTNATIQYQITDEHPYNGTSFYRLKQVDHGGDFEYSEIQQVYIDQSSGIVLFPNPTVEELQVIIPHSMQADAYQIININGQIVQTGEYEQGNLSIQVNELANGIYFFDLQSKGKSVKQIKFIKQ